MGRGLGTPARKPRDKEMTAAAGEAAYLYCVVRMAAQPRMGGVPEGLPGAARPIAVQAAPSTWLILSEVPLSKYGPRPLEDTLRDLERVAELAVAHESVVEYFARASGATVVPMKMFSMFSSVERAIAEMRDRRNEIDAVLDRVAGCEEWGVRITARASRVVRSTPERPRSGTAFLAARKRARDQARNAVQKATHAAALAFEGLSALAREARQRKEVPPGATAPLLDAAFLIPARSRAKFRAAAKRLSRTCAAAGADLTLTGPWPAYNFVEKPGD